MTPEQIRAKLAHLVTAFDAANDPDTYQMARSLLALKGTLNAED